LAKSGEKKIPGRKERMGLWGKFQSVKKKPKRNGKGGQRSLQKKKKTTAQRGANRNLRKRRKGKECVNSGGDRTNH